MSRRFLGVVGLLVAMSGCGVEEDASRARSVTLSGEPAIRTDVSGGPSSAEHSATRRSVQERMVEDDRSWMKAHPNDHLASVVDVSGSGVRLHLTGAIAAFEGQSMIALVNVSRADKPIVLQKWFEAGGGTGMGKLDVVVEIPKSVAAGDCLAVKNVSGGRGFTEEEIRVKQEFGAFLYAFTDDGGQSHPTGTTAPKVFGGTEKCLEDAAANR